MIFFQDSSFHQAEGSFASFVGAIEGISLDDFKVEDEIVPSGGLFPEVQFHVLADRLLETFFLLGQEFFAL